MRGQLRSSRDSRAFTLFEVMLAIALVVLLGGGMYGFLWNLLGERDALTRASAEAQAADACLERLEADLLCALAGQADGPGIKGLASEIVVLTRGVSVPLRSDERAGAMGDLHGTQIVFDPFAGQLRARRWTGPGAPAGVFEVISAGVERMRLRYFDGRVWRATFDTAEAGELPVAIEAAVWFGPPMSLDPLSAPTGSRLGGEGESPVEQTEDSAQFLAPTREPDRRRVIIVPDGPVAAWKEAR